MSETETVFQTLCAQQPGQSIDDHMLYCATRKFREGPFGTHFDLEASVKVVGAFTHNIYCSDHSRREAHRMHMMQGPCENQDAQLLLRKAVMVDRIFEATVHRHPDAFMVWARLHADLPRPQMTPPWHGLEKVEGFHYPDLWARLEATTFKAVEDSFKAFLDFQTTKTIDVGEVKTLLKRLGEGRHYMRLLSELFDEFNRKIVQKHFKRYPPNSTSSHLWRMPITFFTPKDIFIGKRSYLSELYSQVETANA